MGIAAFGTLLKIGDGGATEAFTTIAEVQDISGPGISVDTEDITNHSSTASYEEVVATVIRSGEVTFDINYDPVGGTHDASTGLIADLEAKALRNFQLIFPDTGSTQWDFAAYVTGFEPGAPVTGKLNAAVSLKLSGQPTLA